MSLKKACWTEWFVWPTEEKKNIRYKRTGYNMNVMRQTAVWWLIQSRLTTLLSSLIAHGRVRPKNFHLSWFRLDALSLVGPSGFNCWICVALALRVGLQHSSCFIPWILIYMFAVLMHTWVRSPSRGPNNLYIYELQQNLGWGIYTCKIGLSSL